MTDSHRMVAAAPAMLFWFGESVRNMNDDGGASGLVVWRMERFERRRADCATRTILIEGAVRWRS